MTTNIISIICYAICICTTRNLLFASCHRVAFTVILLYVRPRVTYHREISWPLSLGSGIHARIFSAVSGNWRGHNSRISQLCTVPQPWEPQYPGISRLLRSWASAVRGAPSIKTRRCNTAIVEDKIFCEALTYTGSDPISHFEPCFAGQII